MHKAQWGRLRITRHERMHFAIFEKRGTRGSTFCFLYKGSCLSLRCGIWEFLLLSLLKNGNWSIIRLYARWGVLRCDYPCNIRLQLTFFFDKPLEHFACLIICKDHVADRKAMPDVRNAVACSATSKAMFSRNTCSSASAVSVVANRQNREVTASNA